MEVLVNRNTNTVCFDVDFLTTELDLSHLDPMVDIVLFDTETGQGLKYFSDEAKVDGYLKPEESIDYNEWRRLTGPIVDLAQAHWDAQKYPFVMFRLTANADEIEDGYFVGQREHITKYPHPTEAPEGYTLIESPNPYTHDPLVQWTGTEWFRAPFKYDDDIVIQKQDFKIHLLSQITAKINNQLRIYSMYDIIESGKSLEPADNKRHGHPTMNSYINELKARLQPVLDSIDASVTVTDLLQLSFDVDDLF